VVCKTDWQEDSSRNVRITITGARQAISLRQTLNADARTAHPSHPEHACVARVNDPKFVLHRL